MRTESRKKPHGSSGGAEPTDAQRDQARDKLVGHAANVFTGPLIDLIDGIRREKEQTIDHDNLDTVLAAGWSGDAKENAEADGEGFSRHTWKSTETRSRR